MTDNEIMAANLPEKEKQLLLSLDAKPQTWSEIYANGGYTYHDLDFLWIRELVTINMQDKYYLTKKGQMVRCHIHQ